MRATKIKTQCSPTKARGEPVSVSERKLFHFMTLYNFICPEKVCYLSFEKVENSLKLKTFSYDFHLLALSQSSSLIQ